MQKQILFFMFMLGVTTEANVLPAGAGEGLEARVLADSVGGVDKRAADQALPDILMQKRDADAKDAPEAVAATSSSPAKSPAAASTIAAAATSAATPAKVSTATPAKVSTAGGVSTSAAAETPVARSVSTAAAASSAASNAPIASVASTRAASTPSAFSVATRDGTVRSSSADLPFPPIRTASSTFERVTRPLASGSEAVGPRPVPTSSEFRIPGLPSLSIVLPTHVASLSSVGVGGGGVAPSSAVAASSAASPSPSPASGNTGLIEELQEEFEKAFYELICKFGLGEEFHVDCSDI